MAARRQLSPREVAFAEAYAVTGNATKSAELAGYKPGRGIRTTAWRLKNRADIRRLSTQRSASATRSLEAKVTRKLLGEIEATFTLGVASPACDRAMRLMYRLGMFPNNPFARSKREAELPLSTEQCKGILELAEKAKDHRLRSGSDQRRLDVESLASH